MDAETEDDYHFGFMPALRSSIVLACFASAASLVGCGSETGLRVPEVARDGGVVLRDAGLDSGVDAALPCFDVPIDGGPINAAMRLEAQVGRADVAFVIDVTSSMREEIDKIRGRLRDVIAPAIREAIPDSQLAVMTFGDFPVSPYGTSLDDPFSLVSPSTSDIARVQAAVDSLSLGSGADPPESQVEALYQFATGEGLAGYVAPSPGCPSGGVGYACIRRDAVPVVLLFTDEVMHNGPNPSNPHAYDSSVLGVMPHEFDEMIGALQSIGARVIGFDSGGGAGGPDMRTIGTRTGTVDGSGSPLVFDIGREGDRLTTEVVAAIRTFASTVVQDVDAVVRDADPTDGVDARELVEFVEPLSASPMDGIGAIDFVNHRFEDVLAGTMLTFQIVIRPGVVAPGPEPRFVRAEIVFRGNGRTRLGSQIVLLLIPALDGRDCSSLGL